MVSGTKARLGSMTKQVSGKDHPLPSWNYLEGILSPGQETSPLFKSSGSESSVGLRLMKETGDITGEAQQFRALRISNTSNPSLDM